MHADSSSVWPLVRQSDYNLVLLSSTFRPILSSNVTKKTMRRWSQEAEKTQRAVL